MMYGSSMTENLSLSTIKRHQKKLKQIPLIIYNPKDNLLTLKEVNVLSCEDSTL